MSPVDLIQEPIAWRYISNAKGAKWTVQKTRPAHIETWPGYTVEPCYSADALTAKDTALAEALERNQKLGLSLNDAHAAFHRAEARAGTAEAALAEMRAELERLVDCLDCARLDWEGNNGEIIDKTDPHWTVEASRLCANPSPDGNKGEAK
jgi:exonuclease VII small subunit